MTDLGLVTVGFITLTTILVVNTISDEYEFSRKQACVLVIVLMTLIIIASAVIFS